MALDPNVIRSMLELPDPGDMSALGTVNPSIQLNIIVRVETSKMHEKVGCEEKERADRDSQNSSVPEASGGFTETMDRSLFIFC
jgi:hypothetical protein